MQDTEAGEDRQGIEGRRRVLRAVSGTCVRPAMCAERSTLLSGRHGHPSLSIGSKAPAHAPLSFSSSAARSCSHSGRVP